MAPFLRLWAKSIDWNSAVRVIVYVVNYIYIIELPIFQTSRRVSSELSDLHQKPAGRFLPIKAQANSLRNIPICVHPWLTY
jgi:hypothetical protein